MKPLDPKQDADVLKRVTRIWLVGCVVLTILAVVGIGIVLAKPSWQYHWALDWIWNAVWILLSLFVILQLGRFQRLDRHKKGVCLKCGYDLRASKDRCPECGTPIHPRGSRPADDSADIRNDHS